MVAMKHHGAVATAAAAAAAAALAVTACILISIRHIQTHACQPYEHRSTTDLQLHPLHLHVPRANTPLS